MNWGLLIKKIVRSAVQAGIALLAAPTTGSALAGVGLTVAVDPLVATGAAYGALEAIRVFLKQKVGGIFAKLL